MPTPPSILETLESMYRASSETLRQFAGWQLESAHTQGHLEWRTIGAQGDPPHGGTPVQINAQSGEIVKGPKGLTGHKPGKIPPKHRRDKIEKIMSMREKTKAAAPKQEAKPQPAPEAAAPAEDKIKSSIRDAFLKLGDGQTKRRIRLADVRKALPPNMPREAVDKALMDLQTSNPPHLVLERIDDPTDVKPEDREAEFKTPSGNVRNIGYWISEGLDEPAKKKEAKPAPKPQPAPAATPKKPEPEAPSLDIDEPSQQDEEPGLDIDEPTPDASAPEKPPEAAQAPRNAPAAQPKQTEGATEAATQGIHDAKHGKTLRPVESKTEVPVTKPKQPDVSAALASERKLADQMKIRQGGKDAPKQVSPQEQIANADPANGAAPQMPPPTGSLDPSGPSTEPTPSQPEGAGATSDPATPPEPPIAGEEQPNAAAAQENATPATPNESQPDLNAIHGRMMKAKDELKALRGQGRPEMESGLRKEINRLKKQHGETLDASIGDTGPKGRPAYSKSELERELVSSHNESEGGQWTDQDESDWNRLGANPTTFYKRIPREILDAYDGKPPKGLKVTDVASEAGGEDAMSEVSGVGGERYMDLISKRVGSPVKAALVAAKKSNNPRQQWLAGLYDTACKGSDCRKQDETPADQLQLDQSFKVNGEPVRVSEDEDGQRILRDGSTFPDTPVDALGDMKIPIDKGTMQHEPLEGGEIPDFDESGVGEEDLAGVPDELAAREEPKQIDQQPEPGAKSEAPGKKADAGVTLQPETKPPERDKPMDQTAATGVGATPITPHGGDAKPKDPAYPAPPKMTASTFIPKGSKFYGEYEHTPGKPPNQLYKTPDGKFVMVNRAPFGKILGVSEPIAHPIERNHTLDLGYAKANYYRPKQTQSPQASEATIPPPGKPAPATNPAAQNPPTSPTGRSVKPARGSPEWKRDQDEQLAVAKRTRDEEVKRKAEKRANPKNPPVSPNDPFAKFDEAAMGAEDADAKKRRERSAKIMEMRKRSGPVGFSAISRMAEENAAMMRELMGCGSGLRL